MTVRAKGIQPEKSVDQSQLETQMLVGGNGSFA